jgi:hypothetical protein
MYCTSCHLRRADIVRRFSRRGAPSVAAESTKWAGIQLSLSGPAILTPYCDQDGHCGARVAEGTHLESCIPARFADSLGGNTAQELCSRFVSGGKQPF